MEGIVINTIDYKEKSKIVYLYTPNGISSVKALDVMKKNLGFTVTLNYVEYNVSNGKFPTVLEYSLKKSYFDLCSNLDKINIVNIMIDIIKKLEGEYPHSRIFKFFKECKSANGIILSIGLPLTDKTSKNSLSLNGVRS